MAKKSKSAAKNTKHKCRVQGRSKSGSTLSETKVLQSLLNGGGSTCIEGVTEIMEFTELTELEHPEAGWSTNAQRDQQKTLQCLDVAGLRAEIAQNQDSIQKKDEYITSVVNLCNERLATIENQAADIQLKNHLLSERDRLLETERIKFSEVVASKDAYIASVVKLCDERLVTIQNQASILAAHATHIAEKSRELNKIRNSPSWRLTSPVRKTAGIAKSFFTSRSKCRLSPVFGVSPGTSEGFEWRAIGDDPQFLLRPYQRAILKNAELTLSFELNVNTGSVRVELYFDVGFGFTSTMSLAYTLASGKHKLRVPIPAGCKGIRFDPVSVACEFTVRDVLLSKKLADSRMPDSSEGYAAIRDYGRQIVAHKPVNQLVPLRSGFWASTDMDPHFQVVTAPDKAGWYMLSLQLTGEGVARFQCKLYVDYGDGISESDAEIIQLVTGKLKKRVVHFRKKPVSVRFDPMEGAGEFRFDQFDFSWLAPFYAHSLINKKLVANNRVPKRALDDDYLAYRQLMAESDSTANYQEWIECREKPIFSDTDRIRSEVEAFSLKPVISVVMPTYNTDPQLLRLCIDSVLNQYYPYLELCVADDCSPNQEVRDILREYQARDNRVKLVFRDQNGHISRATNSALEIASGEFVALLDHDDELPLFALYAIAKQINETPDVNIIYSDEDKMDEQGNRFDPHFKSDWNPDLLFSQNYVSHLGVYRRVLIEQIGGFRAGVEGSQDYDLLLRAVKATGGRGIAHVPYVLYHWRAVQGSTALNADQKDYTTKAGIKALNDFFADQPGVVVEKGMLPNTYHVLWPIPEPEPLVSLIIPTKNGYQITKQAIDSILSKSTYQNFEILLVDNNSDAEDALNYFLEIDQHEKVRVLRYPYPFNYSAINNFAAREARGSIIGLINNDVEVISSDWLTEMVRHACRPDVGCVGAKLYYPNDHIQHAGVVMGMGGVAGHGHKHYHRNSPGYFGRLYVAQNFSAVTAAALLVRKDVFFQVGGLNEEHLAVAFNDVDFCLKVVKAGYRNIWTPYAELYHYESISRGAEDNPVKKARFDSEVRYMEDIWRDIIKYDPLYSLNLSLDRDDFSLKV